MEIVARQDFWHAGNLIWPFGSPEADFLEDEVDIDLRKCEFIRPPAVLWCVVYPLLAKRRGSPCRILVPENMGVCIYLKSLGLFQILQENGIDVDDRGIPQKHDPQVVLPLTRFDTQTQAEELANKALDSLIDLGLGAANLRPLVSETFAELALNAVEHAESPIGAYGLIQVYEFRHGQRFLCGVADGGIGIRRSLERKP